MLNDFIKYWIIIKRNPLFALYHFDFNFANVDGSRQNIDKFCVKRAFAIYKFGQKILKSPSGLKKTREIKLQCMFFKIINKDIVLTIEIEL